MATFEQRESGWWQAKVRRKGYPSQSRTFEKKADAEAWARSVENEIDRGIFVSKNEAERTTFMDAADRYRREILPSKRGSKQDGYRLNVLVEEFGGYSLTGHILIIISEVLVVRSRRWNVRVSLSDS